MLHLTHDIWHQYLPCYTWHLIYDTDTCHVILDTWYLTPIYDTWQLTCYHLVLAQLTWYCDTWLVTAILGTCITWHIHDYHCYRDLAWLIYCYQTSGTPLLLYTWTPVSTAFLLLLIAQSDRCPAEHVWCRDDEDVSQNHASVQRILNGTKCHTEQSATPHTWWGHLLNLWGPPLESIPHTEQSAIWSKVPHHTRGGATSWICGATSSLLPVPPGVSVISILSAY